MAPSTITSVNPSDPSGKLTGNALRICVFCASRPGSSPAYLSAARSLAHAIYSQNHTLLYGAGNRGLMGEVARTMSKLGGKVEGVIPRALMKREVKKPENGDVEDEAVVQEEDGGDVEDVIGEVTIVESMHERKAYMAEHGDAFVALPGGFGTLDELVEIITWSQIGIHAKPIVLYNVDGFWDNFLRLVDGFIDSGMVDKATRGIVVEAKTAEEVLERVNGYQLPKGRMELKWKNKKKVIEL